jgi:hypothetical protein
MSYTRPFNAQTFTAYAGDTAARTLALAVNVLDTFTNRLAAVKLRVQLKERPRLRPSVNIRGVYCFEDVPNGTYTLITEPDRVTADFYFLQPPLGNPWPNTFETAVALPRPNPQSPVVNVPLAPNPSYPFPADSTLLRGRATQNAGAQPAAGAVVTAQYDQADPADPQNSTIAVTVETQSDLSGEYVLFFQELPAAAQAVQVLGQFQAQPIQHAVNIREGRTVTRSFDFP